MASRKSGQDDVNPPRPPAGKDPPPARVWKVVNRATKVATEYESLAKAEAALAKLGKPAAVSVKWSDLKLNGSQQVRDLWRQRDLGSFDSTFTVPDVPNHGCVFVKIGAASDAK